MTATARPSATNEERTESTTSGFALVVSSHVLNHTYDSLLPILYPPIMSEFSLSYSLVGMLVMGYRLSSGSLQLIMGFMGRFFRRKFLLGLGMIWQSVTNSFISVSQGFTHVLVNRTLAGIGSSPQHPNGSSYIAENFSREKRGRALGINIAAAQFGSLLAPLIGSIVLSSVGWRNTILVFSTPGILVGIAFLFLKEPKRPMKWPGVSTFSLLLQGVRVALSDRRVLAAMVVETVMAFRIGAGDFLPSYFIKNLGMATLEAGVVYSLYLGTGIFSAYFWGRVSDVLERRKVAMSTMGAAAVLWYLLSYGGSGLQLLAILIPLGFVSQGIAGVVQAFVADATTKENRDIVYGIYFTIGFTIASFSPVIMGYLADTLGFYASFTYVALVSLSAVVASYFLK